jgi:hypothetical protein
MRHQSIQKIFLWPFIIAVISFTGLVTALLFDDVRELISVAAVALPIAIAVYFYWLRPRSRVRNTKKVNLA